MRDYQINQGDQTVLTRICASIPAQVTGNHSDKLTRAQQQKQKWAALVRLTLKTEIYTGVISLRAVPVVPCCPVS